MKYFACKKKNFKRGTEFNKKQMEVTKSIGYVRYMRSSIKYGCK